MNSDVVINQGGGATFAPSNYNISQTFNSVTFDTGGLALNNANPGVNIFGIENGGSITDNASNAVIFNGNLPVTLNGAATITSNAGTLYFGGGFNQAGSTTGSLTITNNTGVPIIFFENSSYTGSTTITAGALQLGNGIGDGSIASSLVTVDGGANLIFDERDPTTFSGAISGGGSLYQEGATLVLTGANTYSGGTTITTGSTLQIGSDTTSGSILSTGAVVDNGVLDFHNTTNSLQVGGLISGGGSVSIDQNTLIYTNSMTYSGGTTIGPGATLQIGTVLAQGGLNSNGAIVDNGTLTFVNIGSTETISGGITGTGVLQLETVTTPGTLVLTGTNTYSGGTTIIGGTLQIGNNTTAGSLVGDVTDGGTLDFNNVGAAPFTFSGKIQGSGTLQVDSGTVILTNANNFIANTNINGGTLQIGDGSTNAGSLFGNVSIASGATLAVDPPTGQTLNLSGIISGAGGVNQIGSGTTVLSGADTFNGNSNVTAGTLEFQGNSFTGTGSFSVSSGATLAFMDSSNFTFGNLIQGAGNLSQAGSGTLIITGADTYSGSTTIAAGSALQIGNGGGAGSIANTSGVSDGGSFIFDFGGTTSFAPAITGTGSVTQNDTTGGTLTLTGANGYSGGTNIAAGILAVSQQGNLGTGAVNFTNTTANGATLEVTSAGTFALPMTLGSGGGTVNTDGNQVIWSGLVSGPGSLTVTDNFPNSGTLILTGNDTYAGGTTITPDGTLQIGNGTGTGSIKGNVDDEGFLVFNYGGSTTYAGVISGAGQVTQNDATGGTLTLSGANTYTGPTNLIAGILSISANDNLGGGGTSNYLSMSAGTTLAITASGTYAHGVQLTGDPTFSVKAGKTINWSGVIADGVTPGTLNVSGGGTFQLSSGANTYSGGTLVNGGSTLQIDSDAELGVATAPLTLGDATSGGTLAVVAPANVTLGAGRTVTLGAGGGTISTGSGLSFEIAQGIAGTGALTVSGPGTFILAGTSTYTGNTNVSSGATLQVGDGTTAGTIASTTVTDNGSLVFNEGGDAAFGANIIGAGGLTQNDTAAGTLTLTGADTYTGPTTITSGTLQLGDGTTAGSVGGDIADNSALVFNEPADTTFARVISGTGSVTVKGGKTLTLTGNNTYSGQTTINNSTLQLGNGGSLSNTSAILNNGGVLVINTNGSVTIQAPVSGSGQLKQIGSGTTTLTGNNTYSGTTTVSAGTLQIGNGGTSGVITSNVVDNAALTFNRSDTSTYVGTISGSGSLTQAGTGTLVLTGSNNTYAGATTISSGTLQIGDGATSAGSLPGNVTIASGAALATSTPTGQTLTLTGNISGAGALNQVGPGKVVLAGANTYTGTTTVSAGVLQVGDGATHGSLTSNITDNASVVFNRTDSSTYGGAITGSGSVTQAGTGTTVLTGDSNYGGGTTITAGTLQLGSASATGSITGNVTDNGTLAFDRSSALTFTGVIQGAGGVTQAGGGITTLTGNSTYTGATSVTGGTLLVNGSIASSATTVGSGGTISGTGTTGALTIGTNGTVAPGSGSFGTLNVNGSFTMAPGSTYAAQVTPVGSDFIQVSGTASLNGATLTVTPTGTGFGSAPIPILTASNGLNGTFSSLNVLAGPNAIPMLSYNADSAFLSFVPTVTSLLPTTSANTNQSRVADAVDFALMHDNAIQFAPVTSETGAALSQTLSELSGETAVAFQNVAQSSISTFMNSLFDPSIGGRGGLGEGTNGIADNHKPVQLAFNGPASDAPYSQASLRAITVWTDFYGSSNTTDANLSLGTHRTTATQFGGTVGLDYRPKRGDGAIGIAVGVTGNNWDLSQQLGKGSATAYEVGGYYSRRFWGNYMTAGVSFAHYSATTDRTLALNGTNLYHAAFDANSFAARAEVGRVFETDMGLLTPYARFQAADLGLPHYAETTLAGSSAYALSYTSKQHYDYTSEVGGAWNTLVGPATDLHARLGWLHDYAGGLNDTATFTAFNGASFMVDGASPPKDAAHLVFGISHSLQNVTLALNAEGAFGGNASSYGGTASVSYRW